MTTPVLYDFFRSSSAFRVRIALHLKGVKFRLVPVDLRTQAHHSAEYLTIAPAPLVPVLEVDGKVLAQSPAIVEWLDAAYPQPMLVPDNPIEAARVRAGAAAICCDIHPLNNRRVLEYLRNDLKQSEDTVRRWTQTWITQGFDAVERMLPEAGRFCFGDAPGLADVCLVPQAFSAERFGVDLADWPRIRDIYDSMKKLKAVQRAWPKDPGAANASE